MNNSQMPASHRKGFTLPELVVVLAVLTLLCALIVTALANSRGRAQKLRCFNNVKRLSAAWLMYTVDYNGYLPLNSAGYPAAYVWTGGNMSKSSEATNTALITSGLLYGYVRDVKAYRCPSDPVRVPGIQGPMPRTRTYSMNYMMAGSSPGPSGYVICKQVSDVRCPKPSQAFVFVEENPSTVDAPCFELDPGISGTVWTSLPAFFHGSMTVFSFADGHASAVPWLEPATPSLSGRSVPDPLGSSSRDLRTMKGMTATLPQ